MKKTEIKCPVCGSTFELPEHETTVKNATVIGKDSGLGTIYLKVEKRKEALQKAGVDISKYFSVKSPSGEEKLMKWESGNPVAVDKDDPVLQAIMADTVPNRKLFRRWVMAQMFRALIYNPYRYSYRRGEFGFTPWLKRKGYEYQWKMVENELAAQAKMWKNGDVESLNKRVLWFNKGVVVAMANDFMADTAKQIAKLPIKNCKGRPYKRVYGINIFLNEIDSAIFAPLRVVIAEMENASTPSKLFAVVRKFNKVRQRTRLSWDMPQSKAWIDAYKGAGAYYTFENLIRFHGATFVGMTKDASLRHLDRLALQHHSDEGWVMLGILKDFIKYNGIDIEGKIASWRK